MTEQLKRKKKYSYQRYIKTEGPRRYEQLNVRKEKKCYKPKNKQQIKDIKDFVDNILEQNLYDEYFYDTSMVDDSNDIGILEIKDFYNDLQNQIGMHRAKAHKIFGKDTEEVIWLLETHLHVGALKLALESEEIDPDNKIYNAFLTYHKDWRKHKYKAVVIPLWTERKVYYYIYAD